jgi:tetratricopeptide (TPR) repeat protein
MQSYHKSILTLLLLFCSITIFAQENKTADANTLLKEGVALNDAGKYAEAIAKYEEILKVDPNNMTALYEKAFTLTAWGKPDEAIPCFEKIIATNNDPTAYVGLANIYDNKGDFEKAKNMYLKGLTVAPKNNNLWFNLSVWYARQKDYGQSQSAAAEAIKANMKHANSYRNYAVAAYQQGKNAEALLALSNYLTLGVQPSQALGACHIIKEILNSKPNSKAEGIAKMEQQTIATASVAALIGKTNLSQIDSLTLQLTAVYKAIKQQQDQYGSAFFSKYFGNYFGTIADTPYMDIFTRFITVSLSVQENLAWLKARPEYIKEFNTWSSTQRRQTE